MGCCLAAALLISFVRRAWRLGRGTAPEPFPPPARRAAPGTPPLVMPTRSVGRRPLLAAGPAGALAVLAYVTTSELLGAASGAHLPWLARDLLWAAAVVALLVGLRPSRGPGESARAVAVAGATWTSVMLVDAHLIGRTFTPAVDVVLHLLGFVVTVVGLVRWLPAVTAPRPPHTARQGAAS
jgi:hypothetical protein